MPRVMIARSFDGPEALELADEPTRAPGADEVTISVLASGVNPADAKLLNGVWGRNPSRLPLHPGSEVSGVVTAAGPDAVGPAGPIAVGDEVIGYRVSGGYAEEITVAASSVLPKPASLGWEEAAGLLLTGVTAFHLLEATGVGEGDVVIIHGGAGSVGFAAVQLARLRGARVIATASERNHGLLEAFGAEPVVYGDGLVDRLRALLPDGADVALDTVGTDEALDASAALVADVDRIATVAGFERAAEIGAKRLGGGAGADPGTELRMGARLPLIELAGRGELTVRVARTYPLAEAAAALALVGEGHPGGKVILLP
ncbi:NADP-dependent oxidoreductase [Leifsonia sp. YIM 134122]|uniref:NADP-dependent oxidoreductase n=1 Tax=Leifsonia stereocauli TaxID=3134136 RepID=A0ABU9W6E6_9MICO